MRIDRCILIAAVLCTGLTVPSRAEVPAHMNAQGVLKDSLGNPVTPGLKIFTFKIFDLEAGGVEIWPAGPGEDQTIATNADGLWNAAVGKLVPLSAAVFGDSSRWLEVTVDDGVNPVETLPRVRLNTVPYAFEASALGGVTADQFVHVPGDTMTGRLVVNVPYKNLPGASFRTNNVSDANTPTPLGGNTIAILGDAKSDGADGKYALVGYADGATGSTVGVFGQGEGAGGLNVGVYGSVLPNGTVNYSGYFAGGDIRVISPDHPGDSSVMLPDDAISSPEILDEPGIAANSSVGTFNALSTAAMADLITVSITTPQAGYIVVEGDFYGWISGSAVSDAVGLAQIDDTAGGSFTTPYYRAWGERQPNTSGNRFYPVSVNRVYFKPAGSYTFRMEAMAALVSGTGSVNAAYPIITATYYPHAYGTVNTVMAASDATEFSEVRSLPTVSPEGAAGLREGAGVPHVSVDLRELELKALRARAEAERAGRELAEAQLLLRPAVDADE